MKTRTIERYLCGHIEEYISDNTCQDYEEVGECESPMDTWANKEPINFGSKRVKSKCGDCQKKEEEENQEQSTKEKANV
jgi:hypothetical protein